MNARNNDRFADSPPPGYELIVRTRAIGGDLHRTELLVPLSLRDSLEAEDRERLKAELEARDGHERRGKEARKSEQPFGSALTPTREERDKQEAQQKLAKHQRIWKRHDQAQRATSPLEQYPVFQAQQALKLLEQVERFHKDERSRLARLYDQLERKGMLRRIAQPSRSALRQLAIAQPHFAVVVQFVLDQLELGADSRGPVRIPPILLVGDAGIGKTHFAQTFAQALAAPLSIQRLDSDITGSFLLGSDMKWGNSQHGLLFELLALGEAANPVVVLDELDKINRVDARPQACLYSLLEPISAKCVRDISVNFELDASLVTWIATANQAERLDSVLLSRLRKFHIQLPNAEQCLTLAGEVMKATIQATAVRGFNAVTGRLERHLAHLTPREIQQITREALGRAVAAGRKQLSAADLPAELTGREQGDGPVYLH